MIEHTQGDGFQTEAVPCDFVPVFRFRDHAVRDGLSFPKASPSG